MCISVILDVTNLLKLAGILKLILFIVDSLLSRTVVVLEARVVMRRRVRDASDYHVGKHLINYGT